MPLNFASTLNTHIAGDVATLAFLFKVTYTDGLGTATTLGFTTANVDFVYAGLTYRADLAVSTSSMLSQIGLQADKFELSGFFHAEGIQEAKIYAKLYNFASVETYLCNWADQTTTPGFVTKGKVGDVSIRGRQWVFEVSDLLDLYSIKIVELTSPTCRAKLFDERCKVKSNPATWLASTAYTLSSAYDAGIGSWVKPTTQNRRWFRCTTAGTSGGTEPTWNTTVGGTTNDGSVVWTTVNAFVLSGSVTSVLSKRSFVDTSITEASTFFAFGKVVWLTGANQGASMEVKLQTGTQVDLYLPMYGAITVGDTFTLYAGCDKLPATCTSKFGNRFNMRAEEWKPSKKTLSLRGQR